MEAPIIKDNTTRSKNILAAFAIYLFVDVVSISLSFFENYVLKGYEIGEYNDEFLDNLDYTTMGLGGFQFIYFIVLVVLFIQWFRRAYGNLIRLEVDMEYTESSAVWGYFIPFVNWVRPVKSMKEIYIKTQETIRNYNSTLILDTNTSFIVGWWITYLVSGAVANYASRVMNRADTIDKYIDANQIYIFSDAVDIITVLLAIFVIQKVSKLELMLKETDKSKSLIDQIGEIHT